MDNNVGQKIKEERQLKNYNQKEFAKKLGISAGFLSKIENDKIKPTEKILKDMALILNVEVGFLLGTISAEYNITGDEYINMANELYRGKNYNEAIETYEKAIKTGAVKKRKLHPYII